MPPNTGKTEVTKRSFVGLPSCGSALRTEIDQPQWLSVQNYHNGRYAHQYSYDGRYAQEGPMSRWSWAVVNIDRFDSPLKSAFRL